MKGILTCMVVVGLVIGCSTSSDDGDATDLATEMVDADSSEQAELATEIQNRVDAIPEDEPQAQTKERLYTFKAMGGISMGAACLTFHSRHPSYLDHVAALGGYINFKWLQRSLITHLFGGFCEMEAILEHIDDLNNPDIPELKCGPVPPSNKWENACDFNHLTYDDSGGDWDRHGYLHPLEGIFTGFGNFLYHNPDHPYLPPGVPASWAEYGNDAEKCKNVVHIGKPYNYNAEYNPEGEYDLITFCDGEEPIPGGEDNPDYWELKGAYDPTYEHHEPVHIAVAVDYNGNGVRDYHEPIAINAYERFEDVGVDGCADADEDGNGGCSGGGTGDDPNGDNEEIEANPFGTEGDGLWQDGEPYQDYGVDGVDGTGDHGEGDGEYTLNATLKSVLETTALNWIDTAPQEEIDAVDIFMDGGIRDAMAHLSGMFPLATHLQAREPNTRYYDGFTEFETSLYPVMSSAILLIVKDQIDWSAQGLGKNFIVRYGDWDATEEEKKKGDGKHLGTDTDMFNRLGITLLTPLFRWPEPDLGECMHDAGETLDRTFYSESMKTRFQYSVSLPPCYDGPGREDARFPVIVFLPGHGITASDAIAAGVAFNILMQSGNMPKFIMAVPEGQCCRLDFETGKRYCACEKNKELNTWDCMDPDCQGTDDECELLHVPSGTIHQECNGGHFFVNQVSNKFGSVELAKNMKYEDVLMDFLNDLDQNFKTRKPAVYEVPTQ